MYVGFKTFYVVRHLESTASYLPTGLHLGFFLSWPSLYLPSSFSSVFLGNLPSAILWTWPYHVRWFCSISFTIGPSNPICCLIVTFLFRSFLDILEDLLRASVSVASTRRLLFSVSLCVSVEALYKVIYCKNRCSEIALSCSVAPSTFCASPQVCH